MVPCAAVTVIVDLPAGVPVGGGGCTGEALPPPPQPHTPPIASNAKPAATREHLRMVVRAAVFAPIPLKNKITSAKKKSAANESFREAHGAQQAERAQQRNGQLSRPKR